MLLCLDIGNTHILCGVFDGDTIILRFRHTTHPMGTADQFGIFLVNILRENGIAPEKITATAICSVVPGVNFTVHHALEKYLKANSFILQAGVKTGLNIKYKNPGEVGADRIAGAIAAVAAFPRKNIICVDMGTATVFEVVTKDADYLGGVIMPGLRLAMQSLTAGTAKLMDVDMEAQETYLGRTTRECIQKGLYFGQKGALLEILAGLRAEIFGDEPVTVIATGGFAQMFRDEGIFDAILPDLVLHGLKIAHDMAK